MMRAGRHGAGVVAFCVLWSIAVVGYASAEAREGRGQPQPLAALAAEPEAVEADWAVTGELAAGDDDILGRKVYEIAGKERLELRSKGSFSGAYAVEALVRFPSFSGRRGESGNATLQCGVVEKEAGRSSACSLRVACGGRAGFVATVRLSPESAADSAEAAPPKPVTASVRASARFPAAAISPVWREEFRIEVENDMASLTPGNELWRRLRIEVRPESVRLYHNGLLLAEQIDVRQADGDVMLTLTGEARLASLEVHRLDADQGPYVPVPLDSVCNAVGPVDSSSLPSGGRQALIEDIPFVFPTPTDRADHVDIGRSVFRYRMGRGYRPDAHPRSTWPSPTQLDPARIMLRVPRSAYKRIWILAASDGEPNSTPVLTVRFFRVGKGWPLDSVARVPEFTARTGVEGAKRLAVKMKDGTTGSLWMLPADIDAFALASDFREDPLLHIELTKEIKDFRAFPDPCNYGSFQGGLPSGVRVYGLTLEKAPVSVIASSDRAGNTYTHPEQPVWVVDVKSQAQRELTAELNLEVTDPYGAKSSYKQSVVLGPGQQGSLEFRPEVQRYGLHTVRTTVACEGLVQSREGAFLALAPDRRKENAKTSRWGLWCWGGTHGTNPNPDDNLRLLSTLGARTGGRQKYEDRKKWGVGPNQILAYRPTPPFALKDPYDPAEYEKFSEEFGKKVAKLKKDTPDLEYISIFAEHSISLRVSHGPPAYAWGEPWWDYNDKEKGRVRSHFVGAKSAFEGCRKHAPGVKLLFGHCTPLFGLPFMREKFPKELFDGFGLDSPQFERMPERPPRAAEPSLLSFLKPEMERWGYEDRELVHLESYFPSSHRLALGHRRQADSVVRTAVLSLSYGSDRFLHCWSLHDCEDYWGTQHYGCVGLIGRRPEFNPKPAAAAFATMTQMLDTTNYDGYLPTGSRSAFCLRFKAPDRLVYSLWTIRGSRPMALTASQGSRLVRVDENGNETALQPTDGRVSVTVAPTPVWVVVRGGKIVKAEAGAPTYSEAPGPHRILLEDFESADWTYSADPYLRFAENHWDVRRFPGAMDSVRATSAEQGSRVWRVTLKEADPEKPFLGWYGVFTPPEPIPVPGKARALGIYARGNSGWGRIVYEVVDAKGEIYLSCGTKDAWNCDDTHSWSYFNFDGWRYMEFPLPGNSPGDNYREKDSVWWGHSAEGVVDLPLKLNRIIFEMPGHQLYVNEVLPVEDRTVEVDDLIAVYDTPEMMSEKPVAVQRAAAAVALRPFERLRTGRDQDSGEALASEGAILPNPIEDQRARGVGDPPEIAKLYPPDQRIDGTRLYVSIKPVEGAKEYQVWVAAYADGRGAQVLARSTGTEVNLRGLKPDFPLYFFVTYTDAQGKMSKPSTVRKTVLRDEFPMK